MMDVSLLSDSDLGLSYPASGGSAIAPGPAPAADIPDDHEITVHRGSAPAPLLPLAGDVATIPATPNPSPQGVGVSSPAPPAGPKLLSDDDLGIAPHQTGILSNAPDDGYLSGAAKGAGTAAVKAVGNSVGFVGGLGNFADYLVARAEHAITGKPVETILGDLAKAKQAQSDHAAGLGISPSTDPRNVLPGPEAIAAPILKRTGEYVPTSEPGKLAQAGTEAALSVLGPGGGAKVGTYLDVLKGAAAMAPTNFAAGAVGQGVTDVTGDPLLGVAAGFGGGAAAHGGVAAVKKVAGPAVMGVPGIDQMPIIGPKVSAARDNAAGAAVLKASDDPTALKDWAAQPAAPTDVPNSPRTLAGAVGNDRGLYQAEKDARNVNNLPFNAVDAAQSAAQQGAIRFAQPEGDVFRPGQVIRQRLDAIDQGAQAAEDRLNAAHQDAVTRRSMATQAYADQQRGDLADRTIARGQASGAAKASMDADAQAAHDRLVQSFQDAHSQASQAATDAAAPLRDLPPAEQTGAALRQAQGEATSAAKQARDALYRAVDPDGTLATVVTPLKEAKNTIKAAIDPHTGVEPSGAEAKLWSDIDRLPDVVPFRSLQKLDSRVTAAMADARRNPNPNDPEAISRLTQLKSATMDAIHNGVENQAAHEAGLVQRGVLSPENTVDARIRDLVHGFYERQQQARVAAGQSGADGVGGSRSTSASGLRGAESAGAEGRGARGFDQGAAAPDGSRAGEPEVKGSIAYQAPAFGDRTVSAQMHGPAVSEALGADVPGTMVRPFSGPLDRSTNLPQGIVAYHGTPHEFERFSSASIGSGEGAQAYGHGLYFAENQGVAKGYQDALSRDSHYLIDGKPTKDPIEQATAKYMLANNLSTVPEAKAFAVQQYGEARRAVQEFDKRVASGAVGLPPEAVTELRAKLTEVAQNRQSDIGLTKTLKDGQKVGYWENTGNLYQVKINRDPEHFLDWETSLDQQSPHVQAAVAKLGIDYSHIPVEYADPPKRTGMFPVPPRRITPLFDGKYTYYDLAKQLGGGAAASEKLSKAGVAGIRYFDAGSRSEGAGTRNFVTFNDRDIQVTHRNGKALERPLALPDYLKGEARGAFVKELTSAGMSPASFSKDLKVRADRLLQDGKSLDHGTAFENAYGGKNAELRRTLSPASGGVESARGEAPGSSGGVPGNGLGRGSAGEAGGSPSQGLAPNFTSEASERLTAAKAAHAAYAQTFKNPTVKGALETNGHAGQYKTPDSAIPSKWIVQGDKGYETAKAFLAASANDPRGIAAMQDAALAPLRKNIPPVGNLNPNALARFKEAYGGSLRAIDEVSPGFSNRFDNAANATQALLDLGVEQKQALAASQRQAAKDAFVANAARREELGQATATDRAQVASLLSERAADDRAAIGQSKADTSEGIAQARGIARDARATPAGQFLGQGGDRIAPTEVENAIGNRLKTGTAGVSWMRSFVSSIAHDQDALAGARKAGIDWMIRSFQNADGTMSGAKFISFVRDNKDVLKELYGTAHVSMFGAVARDLEANAKWRTETAVKGGSDTAKNMRPMVEKAVSDAKTHLSIGAAATAGFLAGGPKGALGGAGLYLLNGLRSAGVRSVEDLYREALLDPEKARFLISKMPASPEGGKLRALTGALRRGLIVGQQQTAPTRTVH